MKKTVRLTESDLARIVKRIINEDESQSKDCSPEILAAGGTLYASGEGIMLSYKTEGANSTCKVGPAKGAAVTSIKK